MAIQYPQRYDDDFINTIKKLIDHVNEYGKTIKDLVTDGQLTEEQYAELIIIVDGLLKSGEVAKMDLDPALKEEVDKIQKKADTQYVNSRLSEKRDVTQQIRLSDLHTDAKEAMTGGSVPVVGVDAVGEENLKSGAATYDKRTILGDFVSLQFGTSSLLPNIDTQSNKVVFKAPFYVVHGKKRIQYNDDVEINLLSLRTQSIAVNINSGAIQAIAGGGNNTLGEHDGIVMSISLSDDSSDVKSVICNFPYTVNGINRKESHYNAKIAISSSAEVPRFDWAKKKITLNQPFYLSTHGGGTYTFTGSNPIEVDIPTAGTYYFLTYNIKNENFEVITRNSLAIASADYITFAYFVVKNNRFEVVDIDCQYTIFPENTIHSTPGKALAYYFPPVDISGYYEPTETIDFNAMSVDSTSTSISDFNDNYKSLVDNNLDYMSRILLGNDESDTIPMYEYTMKPEEVGTSQFDATLPKIIFTVGIHGSEKFAALSFYYFVKDLCENWRDNPLLEYLRWNVEIKFIASGNPWGFDNDSYENSNGVNLNRNFGHNWTYYEDGTAGSAAYSEQESKYIRDFIEANTDAIFLGDYHNHSSIDFNRLLWVAPTENMYQNENIDIVAKHVIQKCSYKFVETNDFPEGSGILGRVSYSTGAMVKYEGAINGIPSATVETMPHIGGHMPYHTHTIKAGTEYIGNFIITLLNQIKHATYYNK